MALCLCGESPIYGNTNLSQSSASDNRHDLLSSFKLDSFCSTLPDQLNGILGSIQMAYQWNGWVACHLACMIMMSTQIYDINL